MPTRIRRAWMILALSCGLAAPAGAVDTWRPYPEGPRALELYVTRYGQGRSDKAARGLVATIGPAWGLDPRMHAYLFASLSDSDELEGSLSDISLGLFRNLKDGALKLDIFGELGASGEDLDLVRRLAGLELNIDTAPMSLYARPSYRWLNAGTDAEGRARVGRQLRVSYGAILAAGPSAEILGEIVHARSEGFAELEETWELESIAAGFNRMVSKTMELILEARTYEPDEGEKRIWDFTVGAVTVW